MNGALLQSKIYYGYAQAANHVGLSYQQFRPTSAVNALATGNLVQSLPASFNVKDMNWDKSSDYGKAGWYCVADGRQLLQGDYLTGNGYTYFIGNMEPLLPIVAILCNRIVSLYQPAQQAGNGLAGYGGNTDQSETQYINQFPGSILDTGRTAKNIVNLPGDAASGNAILLLPNIPGVQIKPYDIVKDDLYRRYLINWAELAEHGWRCGVVESET